ncbi:MAG: hypothetical protein ABFS86_00710 [Planctomycetota bacterium]
MSTAAWVRVATLSIFSVLGACASPEEEVWSKAVENLYSFEGTIPGEVTGDAAEFPVPVLVQVQRIRRSLAERSKYVLAQKPNPAQPCREREFTYRFRKPGYGDLIHEGKASTDEKGVLRIPVPAAVREQGSRGLGAELEVTAVLSIGRTDGQLNRTSNLSEPRVRFDGGYVVTLPTKMLSDLWLRFGDR